MLNWKIAQLKRPILRGRDIKRYSYDFADIWLINTHNGIREKGIPPIDVNDYPAIKKHLDKYYDKLVKRQDKGATPYNLRNCAYMEEFSKQKILFQELSQGSCFYLDEKAQFFISNTGYLITGNELYYLIKYLNSNTIEKIFSNFYSTKLGNKGIRWLAQNIENLPIPLSDKNQIDIKMIDDDLEIVQYIYKSYQLNNDEINFIEQNL